MASFHCDRGAWTNTLKKLALGLKGTALDHLALLLEAFPSGAPIEAILAAYGSEISPRTLQRRLVNLQERGIIRSSGRTRSKLYYLVRLANGHDKTGGPPTRYPGKDVPLSAESHAIQQLIQQPLEHRTPKGYDPSLLRNYRPNIDFYLTTTELEKASQIEDPFEQAFFVMVQLPYLQPFDDVNKRVSRLAANIPFNRHNLAPLPFVEVPQDLYIQGLLGVYEL